MHFATISLLLPLLPYVLAAAINASSAVAARAVGDDPDCVWARKYSSTTYLDCQSTINYPQFVIQAGRLSDPDKRPSLTYRIRLGGTGQNVKSWCDGILATINKACGPRLITPLGCKISNEYTTLALDGDDDWKMVKNPGLDLSFQLQYGHGQSFSGSDHDHACIGVAISSGTCPGVIIANGASCFSEGYMPPEVENLSNDVIQSPGPAVDPFKDQ